MAIQLMRRRPSWMTPWGETQGDVFFDRLWPEWQRDMGEEWSPAMDLFEKEGNLIVTAELPGLSKDDLSVTVEKGYITVSGKKESEREEKGTEYYMKEARYGSFSRTLRLPKEVDVDHIEATFKDGVLTVLMPQKEKPESKKIDVH